MKQILQISLAVNVVLLVAVGWRSTRETPMPRTPRGEVRQANQKFSDLRVLSRTSRADPATPWSNLENRDPRRFIENLRSIGCPEQTIRDIVTLRVGREFRNRLLEFEAAAARSWDYTHQQNRQYWHERNEQQQDLRDEMITTLESLFGQSWQSLKASLLARPEWGRDPLESFSVESRRRIREVEQKFRRELNDLQEHQGTGDFDFEDAARVRDLELQKRMALAEILSPQELEEYLYRQSPAADYVRRNVPSAKSESEFQAMVKVALEMEMSGSVDTLASRYGQVGDAYPDDLRNVVQDRKAAFDQALKEMLGEARIAEQRVEEQARVEAAKKESEAQNELRARTQLAEVAESVGIGVEDADRFFNRIKELQPVLEPKFAELQKKLAGTDEEKHNQLKVAMQAEFEKIAVETIGEKGRELVKKLIEADK